MMTPPALNSMQQRIEHTKLSSYRRHWGPSFFIALVNDLVATALRTCEFPSVHFGRADDVVCKVTDCTIFNPFQTKSIKQYRRGHGRDLLQLFASVPNSLSLALSFGKQFLSRYSVAGCPLEYS